MMVLTRPLPRKGGIEKLHREDSVARSIVSIQLDFFDIWLNYLLDTWNTWHSFGLGVRIMYAQ